MVDSFWDAQDTFMQKQEKRRINRNPVLIFIYDYFFPQNIGIYNTEKTCCLKSEPGSD